MQEQQKQRRFTLIIQPVEVDENGGVIQAFEVCGPTVATISLEVAKAAAYELEDKAAELLREITDRISITPLYPNTK